MKLYYIEDNLFHQELFKKELNKHDSLRSIEVHIFPNNQLEKIYKNLESYSFNDSDFFIIDIHLRALHTGIDFAKKIRKLSPECFILFLSNDNTRGLEIINQQIRPDLYLDKTNFADLFSAIEKILTEKISDQKKAASIIELQGCTKIFLVHPNEINYIATINGSRSTLEFYGTHENFIIQDKIKNIKQKLAEFHFFNDLKSFSINPYNIKEINKKTLEVFFKNEESMILSSTSIKKLLHYVETLQSESLHA